MNDREKWRERVRDIRAGGATWWWWYVFTYPRGNGVKSETWFTDKQSVSSLYKFRLFYSCCYSLAQGNLNDGYICFLSILGIISQFYNMISFLNFLYLGYLVVTSRDWHVILSFHCLSPIVMFLLNSLRFFYTSGSLVKVQALEQRGNSRNKLAFSPRHFLLRYKRGIPCILCFPSIWGLVEAEPKNLNFLQILVSKINSDSHCLLHPLHSLYSYFYKKVTVLPKSGIITILCAHDITSVTVQS